MKLDEVRVEYQHIRLSWSHEDDPRRLTTLVRVLKVLFDEARRHRDEALAHNIDALRIKIQTRADTRHLPTQ